LARWRQLNDSREASLPHWFINYVASDIFSQHLFAEFDFGGTSHFVGYNSRTAEASATFRIFTAHQMPTTGAMTLNLAGSGNFDSFAQSLMALLFRHLTISLIEYARKHAPRKPFYYRSFRYIKTEVYTIFHLRSIS
jgi:hypothetical protein